MKSRPPRNRTSLSVVERVSAIVQLCQFESPDVPLSVAEVCRRSGVNRSNLYVSHPDLVASILNLQSNSKHYPERSEKRQSVIKVDKGLQEFNVREKALLYLCLELRAEIEKLCATKKVDVREPGKRAVTKPKCK